MSQLNCDCLHYEWRGERDKPPILFLHGFMGSGRDWEKIVDLLIMKYSCLIVDLPGHGETRIYNENRIYSMYATAELINKLLDMENIVQCYLVGYSMGGRLALFLTLHYPHRFWKVILESASPGLKMPAERNVRCRNDECLARELELNNFDTFLMKWYKQPLFNSLYMHPDFDCLFKRLLQNNPVELARSLRHMGTGIQPSLWGKLIENKILLLLLVGEFDRKFRGIALEMMKCSSFVVQRVIDGCGHNIHFEKPKEFADAVEEFFKTTQVIRL